MKTILKEFTEFISKGNIIELSVAFIMGLALNNLVQSLVNDIINPAISLIFKIPNLSYIKVFNISIGNFINSLIYFFILSISLFIFVILPYNKFKKIKKE